MERDRLRDRTRATPTARKVRMAKQPTVSSTIWWTLRTPMPTDTKPSRGAVQILTAERARCSAPEMLGACVHLGQFPPAGP